METNALTAGAVNATQDLLADADRHAVLGPHARRSITVADVEAIATERRPIDPGFAAEDRARDAERTDALRKHHITQWETFRQTMRDAGLSSPELEEFVDLAIELIAEADDPQAASVGIADLITRKGRA